jgi:hypothetical protein
LLPDERCAVGVLSPFSRRSQSASCSADKGIHASSIIAHNAFSWDAFLAAAPSVCHAACLFRNCGMVSAL